MRICLLTGGGYPYRRDALGGWCRTLVEGLDAMTFDLLSVTDREPSTGPAYPLPRNVASTRAVLVAPEGKRRGDAAPDATAATVLLCRGLLGEPGEADRMFAEGLRRLARLGPPPPEGNPRGRPPPGPPPRRGAAGRGPARRPGGARRVFPGGPARAARARQTAAGRRTGRRPATGRLAGRAGGLRGGPAAV